VTLTRGSLAALVEWGVDRYRPFSEPRSIGIETASEGTSSPSESLTPGAWQDSPSLAHVDIESTPPPVAVAGVFDSSDNSVTRVNVLNGSHHTLSDDNELETVLVFPDYLVVCEVPRSREGAQLLWDGWLDPRLSRGMRLDLEAVRGGEAEPENTRIDLRSWVLPYSCVILLCESPLASVGRSFVVAPLG